MNRELIEQEKTWLNYIFRVTTILKERFRNESARVKWFKRIDEKWKHDAFDTNALNIEINVVVDQYEFEDEFDVVVWVKSDCFKDIKKRLTLSNLSWETWLDQMKNTLKFEFRRFQYLMKITIECIERIKS